MPKKPEDPIGKYRRKAVAMRWKAGRSCACGESRAEALITSSEPTICAACRRKQRGHTTLDNHHPAGCSNHPATVPIPVNDHQTLTDAQYDWPRNTWENRKASPLLAGAACIRGYYDTNSYLNDQLLIWVAKLLEALDETLRERLGPDWWAGTKLEKFSPKPKLKL
jgi:hypothetical protein